MPVGIGSMVTGRRAGAMVKPAQRSFWGAQYWENQLAQQRAKQEMSQMGQAGAGFQAGLGGLGGLVGSYNRAFQSARTANEQRYQQLLGIANQTTGQRAADVRSAYGQQQAGMMQQLARQGMAGTTIAPTMQMGVQREQQASLNRLADQMQQTKLGIIERRQDEYPRSDIITSLAGMLGQGAGAGGTAGGNMGRIVQALSGLRLG